MADARPSPILKKNGGQPDLSSLPVVDTAEVIAENRKGGRKTKTPVAPKASLEGYEKYTGKLTEKDKRMGIAEGDLYLDAKGRRFHPEYGVELQMFSGQFIKGWCGS